MRRIIFLLLCLIPLCLADEYRGAKRKSFVMDLLHHDSILFGQHTNSTNSPKLLREAVLRSFAQANHYSSSINFNVKTTDHPVLIRNGADYLMRFYLNNKNYKVLALVSTGGDLTWINCKPCDADYIPKVDPFEPNMSTYKQLLRTDEFCGFLRNPDVGQDNKCRYKYSYERIGSTSGVLSSDNFYFRPTDDDEEFIELVFGCSHETRTNFDELVQGVIGLGIGKLSVNSQLIKKGIESKFSYCLVPRSAETDSRIIFGEQERNDNEKVLLPFKYKHARPFYYLALKSIKIGETRQLDISILHREVVVDIGIAMTLLPTEVFNRLTELVKEEIGVEPTPDPYETFRLCFAKSELVDKTLPNMVLEFFHAHLHLKSENMFLEYNEVKCLAIAPYDGFSVIGNTAQVDFHVEYDLADRKISFTPTDCTKPLNGKF